MSQKRRDTKGRILKDGEYQRKDGKYEFKYTDQSGVRRSEYSWKLVSTDKVPQGKRCKESLRDIEKRIKRDIEDGINFIGAKTATLNDLFFEHIETRGIRASTKSDYLYLYNKYVRNELGLRKISNIKYSDIKKFYLGFIKGSKPKTGIVRCIDVVLHPIFTSAVRDGYIRSNPITGVLTDIKKSQAIETSNRHALTKDEQDSFINFVKNSKKHNRWYPIFATLLGTGCRIGELLGLCWEDCDFDNNTISINKNLVYAKINGDKHIKIINKPKTKAGTRTIPMFKTIKNILMQERERQAKNGFCEEIVDGYSTFIFITKFKNTFTPSAINQRIKAICSDYNSIETTEAKKECRSPKLLPYFSVHILRHTFCTRLCENETNIKVIQEIMGHSSVSITMDIYNDLALETKQKSFKKLDGKII